MLQLIKTVYRTCAFTQGFTSAYNAFNQNRLMNDTMNQLGPYLNLSQLSGQEMFWWVDPNYRGNVGRNLLKALEDEARNRGAKTFTMMALHSSDGERVGKLYKRRGYIETETHYMRVL